MNQGSLPYSEDMEKGLLSSMVHSSEVREACSRIPKDFFYNPAHAIIFQSLREFSEENRPVDFILLKKKLSAAGQLEEVGGAEFLNELYTFIPTAINWEYYLEITREFYQRRTTILESDRLKAIAYDLTSEYNQSVLEIVESTLTKLAAKTRKDSRSFKTLLLDTVDEIEKRSHGDLVSPIRFGIQALDDSISGLQRGELAIIGASTSMGKSTLGMQAVLETAKAGKSCVIFSLEMTAEQISERMLSALGRVSMRSLRTGRLADNEFPRLTATVEKLATLPIHIEDEFCTEISAIVSRARQLHSKQPLSLIVVDYIQLVESASVGKAANRETHVSEVARRLKLLTKELQVAVIAMSQLNDEGLLRESRAIGHHADLILCIELASDSDRSQREIVIQKGRNIGFGETFAVHFEGAYMTFTEARTYRQTT